MSQLYTYMIKHTREVKTLTKVWKLNTHEIWYSQNYVAIHYVEQDATFNSV